MATVSVSSYRFIDPLILSTISNLQLIAKTVVDGFMLGVHQSPKLGAGLEFNQYRSYQPGDDPARIDWKMFARSDRYFVRESEVETSVAVRFVLDATASMVHEDSGFSKFDYARFVVASLSYLADSQGDAVGLYALNANRLVELPPRRDHQNLHRLLHRLEDLVPVGEWPKWSEWEGYFSDSQQRDLIIFVSDLHEKKAEIREALARLSSLKHEVLLFHLLGENELSLDYPGFVNFEDLETGETVEVDPIKIRDDYSYALQSWIDELSQAAHDHRITYEMLAMSQPLDFALRSYLKQRIKHR
ncbi:DUF58 domain-containing protein [bacterium]|nr:DUF58 domain-containing protein [bacterium]